MSVICLFAAIGLVVVASVHADDQCFNPFFQNVNITCDNGCCGPDKKDCCTFFQTTPFIVGASVFGAVAVIMICAAICCQKRCKRPDPILLVRIVDENGCLYGATTMAQGQCSGPSAGSTSA